MDVRIEPSWKQQLQEEFDKPYFEKLVTFVKDEYKRAHVLPLGHQIFDIFNASATSAMVTSSRSLDRTLIPIPDNIMESVFLYLME